MIFIIEYNCTVHQTLTHTLLKKTISPPSPEQYLDRFLEANRGSCLIHVDELRKLSFRDGGSKDYTKAYFSRGAMSALALVTCVIFVATFAEISTISGLRFFEVCRQALILPDIDVSRFMEDIGMVDIEKSASKEILSITIDTTLCDLEVSDRYKD